MRIKPLDRRTLLRGAGAALALPLLGAMGTKAGGASVAPPKRLVLYFTANGLVPEAWKCNVPGAEASDFTLSKILAPLAPIRDKCLFIEGVPMSSAYHPQQTAVAHAGGMSSLFTGSYAGMGNMYGGFAENTAGYPLNESIDAALARAVGQDNRFPAYYFGVRVEGPSLLHCCFYAGKDQPITANADPKAVLSDLFGAAFNQSQSEAAQRVRDRTSILDAVRESGSALRCRLDAADRGRLDLHLSLVEEVQKSVAAVTGTNPVCALPSLAGGLQPNEFSQFPQLGRAQADLLAMALTCDLTRVAGYYWSPPIADPVYTWLGHTEGHHTMSHDVTKLDLCADVNAWHAQELLYLANKLSSIPEGDGTVLDNTLIVWASDCSNSKLGDPHDLKDVFFTLIGGGNFFKQGRYLKYPGGPDYAHNRLLLALFQYMGIDQKTFGQPEYCEKGPLTGLTG